MSERTKKHQEATSGIQRVKRKLQVIFSRQFIHAGPRSFIFMNKVTSGTDEGKQYFT